MEREQNKPGPEDVADVWQGAQQRRAEDIGAWVGHFFEQRRRRKASEAEVSYPTGNPVLR
jgi:hypothetical protein